MAALTGSVENPMGRIEYNGVVLTGPSLRVTFHINPEKDKSGRTTVGNIYTVNVRCLITGEDVEETVGNINKIRTLLTKAGGPLLIQNTGVVISLNGATTSGEAPTDLNWGPITRDIEILPVGSIAYQVTWIFEFMVAECWSGSAITYPGVVGGTASQTFKQLTFTVAYAIDRFGLTTRVIDGNYHILLHRSSIANGGASNEIPVTADQYRHFIQPEIPLGFERTAAEFQLNEAKDGCRFRITDTQLPYQYAPPPGVMSIQVRHEVSSEGEILGASPRLQNVISGSFEVAFNYPMAAAWNNVLKLVSDRVEKARTALPVDQRKTGIILRRVRISEYITGPRRVDFQWEYTVLVPPNIALNVPAQTGLFTLPGPNATFSWNAYRESMEEYWSNRGIAGLEFNADQDRIVSLCDSADNADLSDDFNIAGVSDGGGSLANVCRDLSGRYTLWDIRMDFTSHKTGYRHVCMRRTDDPPVQAKIESAEGAPVAMMPSDSNNYHRVQSGETGLTIRITGRAERIKKRVEAPMYYTQESFGDIVNGSNIDSVKIVEFVNKFRNFPGRPIGGCLTYGGNWMIEMDVVGNDNDLNTYIDLLEASLRSTPEDTEGKEKYQDNDDE